MQHGAHLLPLVRIVPRYLTLLVRVGQHNRAGYYAAMWLTGARPCEVNRPDFRRPGFRLLGLQNFDVAARLTRSVARTGRHRRVDMVATEATLAPPTIRSLAS